MPEISLQNMRFLMNALGRNMYLWSMILSSLLCGFAIRTFAQEDTTHFSKVFNSNKPYRIFLPANYVSSKQRYPVIYYFHGNKGSHTLDIEGVDQWVKDNDVILVAWNGMSAPEDMRPYNIGFHSNINYDIQFKDYFLELADHIDSTYRTIPDRSKRAVIGQSMGGFMAFFLAGKYPQLIGTAVSSKGSPEFFVGYPDHHTLYSVRYLFKNLYGVRLRFHNSTTGELAYLNNEVHQGALLEEGLDYEYQVYEGGHDITPDQFKDAFDFVILAFNDPLPKPVRWHHADLYPDFKVWGYEVNSNLNEPGFIDMKGVTNGGMNIRTRKWMPDGRPISGVEINVKTAPIYQPNTTYTLFDFNETQDTKSVSTASTDAMGSISFYVNHESHQMGIYRENDPPEIVYLEHKVNDRDIFLDHKKECSLKLRLLNRGGSTAQKIQLTLNSSTAGIAIANPTLTVDRIPSGEALWIPVDFKVTAASPPVTNGAPFRVRFNLAITDDKENIWKDEFDAPVYYDVPAFTSIGIDDGDSEVFGNGNGNNIAEPGESIMMYEVSHRTRLYYDDPYIDEERIYVDLQPDKWGDGYAVSSVIHIAEDCPIGHQIRFLANYEVKEWKTIKRNVYWGTFTITVGEDTNDQ